MVKKRNPTEHTEERSGSVAGAGSPDLPEGAEHAECGEADGEREAEGDRPS